GLGWMFENHGSQHHWSDHGSAGETHPCQQHQFIAHVGRKYPNDDGKNEEILLSHTFNSSQIEWFRQGSALNVLRNKNK
ncbi:MAG: hypothetical protein ACKO7N_10770, partial [Candidatus Nitrosotenuis sp.]